MRPFRYCGDPLFLAGCAAYAINRWIIIPWVGAGFLAFHGNDLLLIACALPPLLWLHRRLRLRADDRMPTLREIGGHLALWSILFEGVGPHWISHSKGDPWDVVCYVAGALGAGAWWHGPGTGSTLPS